MSLCVYVTAHTFAHHSVGHLFLVISLIRTGSVHAGISSLGNKQFAPDNNKLRQSQPPLKLLVFTMFVFKMPPIIFVRLVILIVRVNVDIISHVFPLSPLDPDYLDNGNNKMAIQQADKLLKKHKDLHCAKVGDSGVISLIF